MDLPERSREARFGIVMYGGVSLAIYINGVAQELFRSVQGAGIYKLLKICFDTDIIVDIISGTSAGGINGLLLGYALANEKDFSTTKDLWRNEGDISLLLNGPDADPDTCRSLLNSDGFYRAQLAEAFQTLDQAAFLNENCAASKFDEMDVFITGTSFTPDVYTTFDDAGRAIDMQDYKKIFKLKHRGARSNPGAFQVTDDKKPIRFQALAKLARITSCFPGAFLPVRVLSAVDWQNRNPANETPPLFAGEDKVDDLLNEWGMLKRSTHFLDGGVLDNKPFTPTIGAIFKRPADRPVDRILFYVEPDPEEPRSINGIPSEPTFASAVANGVLGISTYQSTTDDARLVEEHNTRVVRHTAICRELAGKLGSGSDSGVGIPSNLTEAQRTLYISARNTQLASRAIRGLLRDNETGAETHLTSATDRERAKMLFHSLNERSGGELTFEQTFQRYDIYFRLRRLNHAIKYLYLSLPGLSEDVTQTECARKLLQGLNQQVQFLEIVQHWFEYALDRIPVDWRAAQSNPDPATYVWGQVSAFIRPMLADPRADDPRWLPISEPGAPDWLSTAALDKVNLGLGSRVKRILRSPVEPITAIDTAHENFYGILQWSDEVADRFFDACADETSIFSVARSEYEHFLYLDSIIFPLDYISSLTNLEEIKLLRISPSPTLNDQGQGFIGFKANSGAEDKLAGRLIGHFSGFLKRSWRSNDILWGRLDGLRHIVLALATKESIERVRGDNVVRQRVGQCLGGIDGLLRLVKEVFPQSPDSSHVQLASFLGSILQISPVPFDQSQLDTNLNLLVEMGQLEIIGEEIQGVFRDASTQQIEWNRFLPPPRSQTPTPPAPESASPAPPAGRTFVAPAAFLDPALIGLQIETTLTQVTQQWNQGIAAASSPKGTPLGRYFENDYNVAGEGLERGIPPLILAGYLTRLTLILDACLLGSVPPGTRTKIAGSPIYRLAVRLPLRISHGLVRLWLREPRTIALVLTTAFFASLTALVCFGLGLSHPAVMTGVIVGGVAGVVLLTSLFILARKAKLGL
jgi:patatin-related protein